MAIPRPQPDKPADVRRDLQRLRQELAQTQRDLDALEADSRLSDDRIASGIRTASTVVSVSGATAPTANQILTASAPNAASWVTHAGLGGVVWSPDVPPTSPSSLDDEFTAGSLDGKWAEWDPGSILTTSIDTARKSLKLASTYNGVGNAWGGIYQAVPGGGVAYTAYTKMGLLAGNRQSVALFVAADVAGAPTTADFRGIEVVAGTLGGGACDYTTRLWTAYNAAAPAGDPTATRMAGAMAYARIRSNGSTGLSFDVSNDGVGWWCMNTVTLGFTPSYIVLAAQTATTGSSDGIFKFFRVFSGAGANAPDATKIGGFI